jgi:ABC-type transporter lipoprotein component MlaA
VAGLFDVAKHVGLEQNEEDFDQTLAVWGVPQGSYLVLPFWGHQLHGEFQALYLTQQQILLLM